MSDGHKPEILVIAEDDANRQLMNGFKDAPGIDHRRIRAAALPTSSKGAKEQGGWPRVRDYLQETVVPDMLDHRRRRRLVVLLLDKDEDTSEDRYAKAKEWAQSSGNDVSERIFVLGARIEPEILRKSIGKSLMLIGMDLARECTQFQPDDPESMPQPVEKKTASWTNDHLRHNFDEIKRLRRKIMEMGNFLFC